MGRYKNHKFRVIAINYCILDKGPFFQGINRGPAQAQSVNMKVKIT